MNWIEPRGNGSYINYSDNDYQIFNTPKNNDGCFYKIIVFFASVFIYGSLIITILIAFFMIFGGLLLY